MNVGKLLGLGLAVVLGIAGGAAAQASLGGGVACVSVDGPATCDSVAVSAMGASSSGWIAASGQGDASSKFIAASGTGNASADCASTSQGGCDAHAFSVGGDATATCKQDNFTFTDATCSAVSVFGDASGYNQVSLCNVYSGACGLPGSDPGQGSA